jgi:hypothetical protein
MLTCSEPEVDYFPLDYNQSTIGKLSKRNDSDLVQAFLKKWWVESDSHYILGYNYNMHKPAQ